MVVLGLSPNHDASVCLVIDGKIVSAISRERLSRKKKDRYVTQRMIDYVLKQGGITIDDVDYVAISYWFENRNEWKNENEDFKFYIPEEHAHIFTPNYTPNSTDSFSYKKPKLVEGLGYQIHDDLIYLSPPYTYQNHDSVPINFEIYQRVIPGWFVSHHHAHAASAFYTTNYNRSAIFTLDATDINPYSSSLFCWGNGNRIETLNFPGVMIAHAYSLFTQLLNVGHPLWKAGSTMGLAAYGSVNPEIIKKLDNYTKSFWEKKYDGDEWRWVYNLFMNTVNKPIRRDWVDSPMGVYTDYTCDFFKENGPDCDEGKDAAATIQYVFEETIFRFLNQLYEDTKLFNDGNLCLAGGSFLNCTTNGKIHKRTQFKNISPYPGAGDDGLSVGSALFVSHHILDVPRRIKTISEVVYTGKEYDTPDGGIPLDLTFVARSIHEGKVVAWFQGGSEFGPRALGNRSFLANPKISTMRDYINFEIKNREWFRPFAPAVCVEDVNKYFDIEGDSPYMLKICNVITDKLPAVTHVDGTARVQTVKKEDNPKFYEILREFEEFSGVPVLLNTSLNLSDEPIVETPQDALRLFNRSKTDILVINDSMWVK
jgi:carbamoyltransferase